VAKLLRRLFGSLLSHGAHDCDDDGCQDSDAFLRRPALPLLLVPLATLWAGLFLSQHAVATGMLLPAHVPSAAPALIAAASAVASLGLFLAVRRTAVRVVALSLLSLVLGCAVGAGHWLEAQSSADALRAASGNEATVTIVSDPRVGSTAAYSTAELEMPASSGVEQAVDNDAGLRALVRVRWASAQEPPAQGTRLEARFNFTSLREHEASLFEQGIVGTVSLVGLTEPDFRPDVIGALHRFRKANTDYFASVGSEGAALMCGMLLGNTELLQGTESQQGFRVTGLAHLIAVSGSHLAVIAGLLSWLLSRLPGNRVTEALVLAAVLAAYVAFTGFQPSAIRAAIMSATVGCSFLAQRRSHAPSALAAAAFAMLLLYPPNAFSAGFWLSVFAVLGIALFCPLVQAWVYSPAVSLPKSSLPARVARASAQALGLTLTAQAATLPLCASMFSMVPLIGPLANLVVTPIVTIMVGGGMAALCLMLASPQLAMPLLDLLCKLGDLASTLANKLASMPYAAIPMSYDLAPALACAIGIAALVYIVYPRPRRNSLLKLLIVFVLAVSSTIVIAPRLNPPQLVVLDVGQGDALLVREGGHAVLVDTGQFGPVLIQALARQRVYHLDAVILTHLDADHTGALGALQGVVSVDAVFFADGLSDAQGSHQAFQDARRLVGDGAVLPLAWGDELRLGSSISLHVVSPRGQARSGNNAESIVMTLFYDSDADGAPESTALLTGDAEAPELAQALAGGGLTQADILKVGHHGSGDAVRPEQLARLGVRAALISVGAGNRYGHPAKSTLRALEEAGVSIYCTDRNGDITVVYNDQKTLVRCATMMLE
jgi:competence protein ComEC